MPESPRGSLISYILFRRYGEKFILDVAGGYVLERCLGFQCTVLMHVERCGSSLFMIRLLTHHSERTAEHHFELTVC